MTSYGIVGAGRVGSHAVRRLVAEGHQVTVVDTDLDKAKQLASGQVGVDVTAELGDLADRDVVLEAVPEDVDTKTGVLTILAGLDTPAVLTATSAFTVSDLATSSGLGARLAGFHFLPTAAGTGLVEIAAGPDTAEAVLAAAIDLSGLLAMPWMRVADEPGRVTRRLLVPFANLVLTAVDRELASQRDIDLVVRLGLGHAVGPLEALAAAGIEDHVHVAAALSSHFGDSAFAPPPALATPELISHHLHSTEEPK